MAVEPTEQADFCCAVVDDASLSDELKIKWLHAVAHGFRDALAIVNDRLREAIDDH